MNNENRLQELLDRQDILDCVHRYCRGVDRFDRELVLSVYHSDATDDHGEFVGSPNDFVDWAFNYHHTHHEATHHIVTNHSCELKGDVAHTETYWLFSGINKAGPPSVHFGRYIDRFERRAGKWAIAARACIIEWHALMTELTMPPELLAVYALTGVGRRDRTDLSYQRPLRIKRQPARRTASQPSSA